MRESNNTHTKRERNRQKIELFVWTSFGFVYNGQYSVRAVTIEAKRVQVTLISLTRSARSSAQRTFSRSSSSFRFGVQHFPRGNTLQTQNVRWMTTFVKWQMSMVLYVNWHRKEHKFICDFCVLQQADRDRQTDWKTRDRETEKYHIVTLCTCVCEKRAQCFSAWFVWHAIEFYDDTSDEKRSVDNGKI